MARSKSVTVRLPGELGERFEELTEFVESRPELEFIAKSQGAVALYVMSRGIKAVEEEKRTEDNAIFVFESMKAEPVIANEDALLLDPGILVDGLSTERPRNSMAPAHPGVPERLEEEVDDVV